MSVLSDLKTAVQSQLTNAEAAEQSATLLVSQHKALLTQIEAAETAVPTIAELQELVGRMKA